MSIGRGLLYIASALAFALLARSIFIHAIPLWLAIGAMVSYVALILLGVFFPHLEMFSDVVWKGPKSIPEVALTFDDGPHPQHTREVLKVLQSAGAVATFFVLGSKVDDHPEVLREIVRGGHAIGVHGYAHDRFTSLRSPLRIVRDLERALDSVEKATGIRPLLYRPPVGHVSPRTDTAVKRLGLVIVGWSVRGLDGLKKASSRRVASRVRRKLRPGAIVLLHDAAESGDRRPASIDALASILEAIHAQGLKTVDVMRFVQPGDASITGGLRSGPV
jgi:peptidoglycan/xylan/chitin deacetylase (PgdA/CDA1 family)